MAVEDTYTLGDDLPKQNPWRDDRLGYTPFCERLSKVLINLKAPNGYVIGLHGEWGSGKSTALNFVRAFLEKHNQETEHEKSKITLVDFLPWIVSGHQDLIAAFFKVMTEGLGVRPNWLKRQWNRLLRALKLGGDPLVEAVATVAVTVDPSVGVASKAMASVAKKPLAAMVDRFLADPSLQAAYDELKKRLEQSGKRFVVTIDDLDRLQEDEIRSIMQMVKTVGRLPNVVYILAYDRSIVWKALGGIAEQNRPSFAEKIVQQEVELPRPSKEALLSILDSETAFLIASAPDTLRWQYIVRAGVRRWIRHPRDVLRLANAVKFSWPALKGEIDPQDLLAMEGLRLFDSRAFDWIRWNRDFLFAEGRFMLAREGLREATAKSLSDDLTESSREEVLRVLSVLFPEHAGHFEDTKFSSEESHSDVVKRRGIGCEAGYDAYFGLRPSSDAIPKAVIDLIVANRNDQALIVRNIRSYIGKKDRTEKPIVGQLLEELRVYFRGSEPEEPTQALLNSLFEVGEDIFRLDFRGEMFSLSPRSHVTFFVADLLRAWKSESAGEHLIAAFERSKSPCFSADIFVDRARELGLIATGSRSSPLISRAALAALGAILLPQIEKTAVDGTLSNAPFFWDIARAWKFLGDAAKAKAWIAGTESSAEFLAKVTLGMVSYSISSRERSYSMGERPDETLYDLRVLRDACQKHLAGSELNNDERNRIQVVAGGERVDGCEPAGSGRATKSGRGSRAIARRGRARLYRAHGASGRVVGHRAIARRDRRRVQPQAAALLDRLA